MPTCPNQVRKRFRARKAIKPAAMVSVDGSGTGAGSGSLTLNCMGGRPGKPTRELTNVNSPNL